MNITDKNYFEKYEMLKKIIASYKSVAIAFSSGVDSTFLLKAAKDVLGDNVIAVTASSDLFPNRELQQSIKFCKVNNIKQIIYNFEALKIEGFSENPKNRCYFCKKYLFENIIQIADENGIKNVLEGSNIDDLGDYRPGLKAISELEIKSPLREAMLTKDDIRILSKELGLSTWNKPSFACLASRFVYGENISRQKLEMVDKAEQLLNDLGFNQFRVRIHDNMARIELEELEFSKIMENDIRKNVYNKFKECGFLYVSLDLKGYRMGSMNEALDDEICND